VLWFCFRVLTGNSSKQVKIILKNVQNLLGGSKPENIRPVIRHINGKWQRLGAPQKTILQDGRTSASWLIDPARKHFDFALCYPYGTEDLNNLIKETRGYWKQDTIGLSQKDRPLIRLSNLYGDLKRSKKGLYLIARQHSGEMSGSWVLDGFLREIAALKVHDLIVWTVPLSNIDGVAKGDYGKDNFPYDLNRAWGKPPMRHETLVLQNDTHRWNDRCKPVLGMDFHSPGACEKDGTYFFLINQNKYPAEYKKAKKWTDQIAKNIGPEYISKEYSRSATYKSRWETPNFVQFCKDDFNLTCLSMETPYSISRDKVLTQDDYRLIGKRIADCIVKNIA